ncbi:MAG: alpha/beta hydrolase [Candidatus Eremiobacteraeota bacterium]|nr:alpha/beta hydrolase [Candidatus Eremiobacteraeota bacterium]
MQRLHQHIGAVPVLALYEQSQIRGTVLVYHGLTACKETQEKELTILARRGFLAVGVDAVGHGERRYPDLERRMSDDNSHVHFLEMVRASVIEIPGLVYELKKVFPDHGSFGLTGISMGGYIAFAAGAICDDIRAVAPILGSPDWSARSPRPLPEPWQNASPHHHPERYYPKALLAQNAGLDEHVPPLPTRDFMERAKVYYRDCPERLQQDEYPHSGHFMREADWNLLWERTVQWFEKYLVV